MLKLAVVLSVLGTLRCLDNGLALKPPMGWMSWASFFCETNCTAHPKGCINENLYQEMADAMVNGGYRELGYDTVHIDDCWSEHERSNSGLLRENFTRFPSGMKALAKYVHDRSLRLGIYADVGTATCEGYPGSLGYEKVDARTFVDWDIDYLKYDGCNANMKQLKTGYRKMMRALNQTGKLITYGCEWPLYLKVNNKTIHYKPIADTCNLFRNFDDVASSFKSLLSITDYYDTHQDKHIPFHGPGHWFDPDMLVVGNKGISLEMARSQMTIWSIWSAPLIMSADLRSIESEFKAILQNKKVIAIDQDPLFEMGRMIKEENEVRFYRKRVTPVKGTRTSFAIAMFNRCKKHTKEIRLTLESLGVYDQRGFEVEDLWSGKSLGIFKGVDRLKVDIRPMDSALFKATPVDFTEKEEEDF